MSLDPDLIKKSYVIYDSMMTLFLEKLLFELHRDNRFEIFIKALDKIDNYGGNPMLFRQTVNWILGIKKYMNDNIQNNNKQ